MARYGFLSTYPPTQCGLATFSAALTQHLTGQLSNDHVGVVRVVDRPQADVHPHVVAQLVNGSPSSLGAAAAALNRFDVAIVQHEYGIYGGRDGGELLQVLTQMTVPTIVVLHTVRTEPSPSQRQVLERIADVADAVVVMSAAAARQLRAGYLVDNAKISVIPHGATGDRRLSPPPSIAPFAPFAAPVSAPRRPTVLTWGLMGPGKGIEWAIEAVAGLDGPGLAPRYLIAGHTHPKVLEREGEAYRDTLRARAEALGVSARVEFDPVYRTRKSLLDLVRQADVVILPYDSTEQATSGVLIEAIAAKRPIVATRFPHAVELLADGAGLLVPQRDAPAMTRALHAVLTRPALAASMTAAAARIAPSMEWSAVADSYRRLAESLIEARATPAPRGNVAHALTWMAPITARAPLDGDYLNS